MPARVRLAISTAVIIAAIAGAPPRALAEEPKLETADGVGACAAFEAKNEKELAAWQKDQPAVPYRYHRDPEVANAPWGRFFEGVGSAGGLILATIIPHVGAQLRSDTPAALVSWPWSFPIFPAYACSRQQGTFVVEKHRAHRIMLEPGIVTGKQGTGFFVRPGYRFVHHPTDWVVGVGGGLGSTIEIAGQKEPFRFSLGIEALLHFGHCCESKYFTLTARYDRFFNGNALNVLGASLGYTYF